MRVDWNDVPGALYYNISSFRQDMAGSANPTTVTTKSEWGTGAHPNAGEDDGYCYYRRVRVSAINNKGVAIASATAESCYMADEDNEPGKYPPKVTRLTPIQNLQKKLDALRSQ
jgi:hypothetical protein